MPKILYTDAGGMSVLMRVNMRCAVTKKVYFKAKRKDMRLAMKAFREFWDGVELRMHLFGTTFPYIISGTEVTMP